MKLFDLTGRKAIVTGGTRGLGYGMAEGLMEAGAEVVIVGSSDKVQEVAATFAGKGFPCKGVKIDLGNREEVKSGFAACVEALGGHLDILVNCAGVQRRHFCTEFPLSDWDDVIEVNLTATFEMCQLAANQMIAQNSKGKIINVASMLSYFGGWTVPAYAASKGGVAQLTKALSNEWTEKGINVNAIAPGYIATPQTAPLREIQPDGSRHPFDQFIIAKTPAARWGTAEDLQGTAVFLASDASDYMAGACIPCDGGYLGK